MSTGAKANEKDKTPPGHMQVSVFDSDAGGPPLLLHGGPGEKVEKVIEALYASLGATASDSDRLLCLATGESVKEHRDMHLRDYAQGLCGDLVWTFARDTGGA